MRVVLRLYVEAFSGLGRGVWLLTLALLVNRAGTMVMPFLALYLRDELGLDEGHVALVMLAYGLGAVGGTFVGGRASDRYGTTPVQVLALGGCALACLAYVPLGAFPALAAGAFAIAFLGDAFRPACMSAAAQLAPEAARARALALLRMGANLGIAMGPALGGVLASIDYALIFVGDALTCLGGAAVLLVFRRAVHVPPALPFVSERGEVATAARDDAPGTPRPPRSTAAESEEERRAKARLLGDPFMLTLLLMTLGAFVVLMQYFTTLPLYARDAFGLDERAIGLLLAWNALLILAFEMPLVKLLERRDPVLLFGAGTFLMGLGFAAVALAPGLIALFAALALITFGEMVSLPFANVTLAARGARVGRVGAAMGLLSLSIATSQLVAPPLGLALYGEIGGGLYHASAGLSALVFLAAIALTRAERRRAG